MSTFASSRKLTFQEWLLPRMRTLTGERIWQILETKLPSEGFPPHNAKRSSTARLPGQRQAPWTPDLEGWDAHTKSLHSLLGVPFLPVVPDIYTFTLSPTLNIHVSPSLRPRFIPACLCKSQRLGSQRWPEVLSSLSKLRQWAEGNPGTCTAATSTRLPWKRRVSAVLHPGYSHYLRAVDRAGADDSLRTAAALALLQVQANDLSRCSCRGNNQENRASSARWLVSIGERLFSRLWVFPRVPVSYKIMDFVEF